MTPSEFHLVYITFPSEAEAKSVGRLLVEEKFAACVNLVPRIHSMYEWEGRFCEDSEWLLLAKSRVSDFSDLAERVRALHSYECPCIVAYPMQAWDAAYGRWLSASTERGAHKDR